MRWLLPAGACLAALAAADGGTDFWRTQSGACRDYSGSNVKSEPLPDIARFSACQVACMEDSLCEAVGWYREQFLGAHCHRIPPRPAYEMAHLTGETSHQPFQGGGEPYDAQCAFRIGCRNAFSHYEGFCKDFRNRDVMADPVPDAVESLEACQAACRADDGCEGVEWYPDTQGWQNHKCHKFPGTPGSGGSSSMQVVQGGGDYLDAQCYVRHCFGGVARLRNDRWQHFTGYCRDRSGTDVQGNPVNLSTLEACQSVCSEDLSCEAIVWYPETVKCWRLPPAPGSTSGRGDSTEMPSQGGGNYLDAQCYLRFGPDSFTHFDGFCTDRDGVDVMADAVPSAESLGACQAVCLLNESCTGIEWYPGSGGWQNHKCHKFPGTPGSGGSSSLPVVQGGEVYLDAQCYVRPHSGAAVSISVAPFLYSLSLSLSLLSANPSLQNLQGLSAWNLALHSSTAEAFHDLLGPLEEPTATSPRTDTYEQDFRNELRDAVRACDVERLGSVLDSGSSLPSARRVEILGESDGSGRTLLHLCPTWANSNNATKAVRKLLDSSANCDAVDAFGRTPLEAAIESCAQREMEDPEPVLKLCEALIPHSSTQVFLDKQTGDTAIGRAVVTLLQDHGVAVEVEGEPAPTEAVEESTVAAGRVGLQPDLSAVTMTFEDQLPAV